MSFHPDFTDDRLLDGRILLRQSRSGFRAGSDAMLLAAACHPPKNGRVLDLGTGNGAAMLGLGWRRPDCDLVGVEIQSDSVDLARFNIDRNVMADRAKVVLADISKLPTVASGFDLVMANPPYFDPGRSRVSPIRARALARGEQSTPLAQWADAALSAVADTGQIVFINRRERLPELMKLFSAAGEISIRHLPPHNDKPAKRILVRVRVGGSGIRELPPLRLHRPGGGPTTLASALLRLGAPIFW